MASDVPRMPATYDDDISREPEPDECPARFDLGSGDSIPCELPPGHRTCHQAMLEWD